MTDTTLPPDWAIQRAIDLRMQAEPMLENCLKAIKQHPSSYPAMVAFARYIAQHEQPPVDPLLIEAREIVAMELASEDCPAAAEACRAGLYDHAAMVKAVLAALRKHSQ